MGKKAGEQGFDYITVMYFEIVIVNLTEKSKVVDARGRRRYYFATF